MRQTDGKPNHLPCFASPFFELFTRWTYEINAKDSGNIPRGVPGYLNSAVSVADRCAYPLCACCCSPELFLNLLSNLLHCHLGLLDGSLGSVKSTGGVEHKETHQIIDKAVDHKQQVYVETVFTGGF